MNATLIKTTIISLIISWFIFIFQPQAYSNWLQDIIQPDVRLDCQDINEDMEYDYSKSKEKIDSFFAKLSTRSEESQKQIYTKIISIISEKLSAIKKKNNSKLYTVLGYLKCESESRKVFLGLTEIQKKYYKFYKYNESHNFEGNFWTQKLGNEYFYIDDAHSWIDLITQLIFNQAKTNIFSEELLYKLDKKIADDVYWNFFANTVIFVKKDFYVIMWYSEKDYKHNLFIFNDWAVSVYDKLQLNDNTVTWWEVAPCKIEIWEKMYSFKLVCNNWHPAVAKSEHLFWWDWTFIKTVEYEFTDEYLHSLNTEWLWGNVEYKNLTY